MRTKTKIQISVLVIMIVSALTFSFSFFVLDKGLSKSLLGFLFVFCLLLLFTMLGFRLESKNYTLWVETVLFLILMNAMFFSLYFVINAFVFSVGLSNLLIFFITYTLVYPFVQFIKWRVKNVIEQY